MPQATLELRDIHLPDPVSWWPIAPGWWLLLSTIITLIIIAYLWRKLYLSKQLKRDIRSELNDIKQQFQESDNKRQLAKDLSILLRRVSISLYPYKNIAGLTGEQWLQYLDATNARSSNAASFNSDIGKTLITAPYLPEEKPVHFDAEELLGLCENWLLASYRKPPKQERP